MTKKELYVGIREQKELRRNALEASKSVISLMQTNQKIFSIQKEKDILKKRLKQDIAELRMLLLNLEKEFPKNNLDKPTQKKRNIKSNSKISIDVNKKEIYTMHRQLEMIEKKLKRIE